MLPSLRALLLDLDGTLIDRDAALRACLREHAVADEHLDQLVDLDRADHSSLTALSRHLHQDRPNLAADPAALARRLRQRLPSFITPDPTITAALTQLNRAGLRLALISNGGPTQRLKLAAAKIDPALFEIIHISSEHTHAKPHRAIFQSALTALDLPASATLMIGDSAEQDIEGAHNLNIPTLWISHDRAYPGNCVAPTLTAPDFCSAVALVLCNLD